MKKFKAIVCMIIIALLLDGAIFSVIYFAREDEDKRIVVTTFSIYDICREILGSEDDILLLQDNGNDMHNFQPTAKDISAISKADLFIYIGGESDDWVDSIIRSANNVNLDKLCLMNYVDKLVESYDGIINNDHTHENGEEHSDEYDEHIWLSLRNMKKMTKAILEDLIDVFPHMEQMLRENANDYIEKLDALDLRYAEVCEGKETTLVMADRFPFLYLSYDYNIKFLAAYLGCSSDTQASVSIISDLIEKVNEEELNYVCVLETSDRSIANSVISDSRCRNGVEILMINSCQAVSHNSVSTISYLDIMESNLEILRKALNNEDN